MPKNIKTFLTVQALWSFSLTDRGQTDWIIDSQGNYIAHFEKIDCLAHNYFGRLYDASFYKFECNSSNTGGMNQDK